MLGNFVGIVGTITFFRVSARSLNARNLIEERRDGTLALLLCTPRRPIEIVLSRMLPPCGVYLGAALGCIPGLVFLSLSLPGSLPRSSAVFLWACSLIVLYCAAYVALTCTKIDPRSVQVVAGFVVIGLLLPPLLFVLFAGQPWARFAIYWNPVLGTGSGSPVRFLTGTLVNLVWSGLCMRIGAWWLTRKVYPARGRLRVFWHRLARRIKCLVPWQAPLEKWLLAQYPIAWLSLRTFSWVAFPLAILLGIVGAALALWYFPGEDTAGVVLGSAGFLAFALVISVRAFVERTIKAERDTRMNEVIYPLPIRARQVALNRLIESAFGVGPSLVLLGLTAMVVAGWFLHWQLAVAVLLGLLEALVVCAMVCLGTHLGTRIRKAFAEPEQWLLSIIGLATIAAIPGSIFLMAILRGEFGAWVVCSLLRIGMDLFLAQFLFNWLTRKIAHGEDVAVPLA
jgi:hypothetical protein